MMSEVEEQTRIATVDKADLYLKRALLAEKELAALREQIGIPNTPCGDPIVEHNVQFLRERSLVGQAKYGTKLDREDLTLGQWIDHAMEEAADLLNYLRRLKAAIPEPLLVMTGGEAMKRPPAKLAD